MRSCELSGPIVVWAGCSAACREDSATLGLRQGCMQGGRGQHTGGRVGRLFASRSLPLPPSTPHAAEIKDLATPPHLKFYVRKTYKKLGSLVVCAWTRPIHLRLYLWVSERRSPCRAAVRLRVFSRVRPAAQPPPEHIPAFSAITWHSAATVGRSGCFMRPVPWAGECFRSARYSTYKNSSAPRLTPAWLPGMENHMSDRIP